MSDKMPIITHLDNITKSTTSDRNDDATKYTIVHNNPDYHVIKKSDVDGDVMGALDRLDNLASMCPTHDPERLEKVIERSKETIRNALIAQSKDMEFRGKCSGCNQEIYIRNGFVESDPEMVMIPRKVLEDVVETLKYLRDENIFKDTADIHINHTLELLNYKPTTSDRDGE